MTNYAGLSVVEGSVADIIVDKNTDGKGGTYGKITGVRLESGEVTLGHTSLVCTTLACVLLADHPVNVLFCLPISPR